MATVTNTIKLPDGSTGYYLLDNPNPNGTANPDGQYHGHMVMRENPRLITLHTGEVFADELGDDLGAENIANYFTHSTVAASYHTVGDSDSVVPLLPSGLCERPVHVAYHCWNRNTGNLGYAFGMRAVDWPNVSPEWRAKALSNGADVVAAWCRRWDIPVRKITLAEADAGMAGISGHGILQPEDRSDPGAATVFAPSLFPWDEFLELVSERLNGGASQPEGEEWMLQHFLRVTEGELKDTVYARYTTGALVPIAPEEFDTQDGKVPVRSTTTAGLRMALAKG